MTVLESDLEVAVLLSDIVCDKRMGAQFFVQYVDTALVVAFTSIALPEPVGQLMLTCPLTRVPGISCPFEYCGSGSGVTETTVDESVVVAVLESLVISEEIDCGAPTTFAHTPPLSVPPVGEVSGPHWKHFCSPGFSLFHCSERASAAAWASLFNFS